MSPQDLETARAFVACAKWKWLAGMKTAPEHGDIGGRIRIDEVRDGWLFYGTSSSMQGSVRPVSLVPDLDDPVTRAALLVVVREARGEPQAYIGASILNGDGAVRTWAYCATGVPAIYGNSEAAALLAALRAAP